MSIPLKDIPDLAERLMYVRRLKDLTQVELAELAGATQQAIQQAEAGKARQPRYLMQLSQALDIPHEWLAMNILPASRRKKAGFSERTDEVVNSFFGMPKKDQDLMLELMKSRAKKRK